jgi:RNA polymerase sigma-70 factor, ECF subfamily
MNYDDSLHFTAVYENGRRSGLSRCHMISVGHWNEHYSDTAGAEAVTHVVELDRLDADLNDGNRDCARAKSDRARSVMVGEGLHEIEALIPRLTRYARTLTRDPVAADDLVQDCLTNALRKIHLWEPGTDLRAWLFTILHNEYVNRLRRDARQRGFIEAYKPYRTLALLPDQNVRLEVREVERALAELPEDQRSLILTIGVEGLSYEDAASAFNLPLGTVRSRLARGRLRLRLLSDHVPSQVQYSPAPLTNHARHGAERVSKMHSDPSPQNLLKAKFTKGPLQ